MVPLRDQPQRGGQRYRPGTKPKFDKNTAFLSLLETRLIPYYTLKSVVTLCPCHRNVRQGIQWICKKESCPERNLEIVRLGQPDILRKLERALENG